MAMIKCTECGKEYSDKASACPNCGCPVSYSAKENTNDNQFKELDSDIINENDGFFIEIDGNREDMTKLWMECDGKIDCIAKLRKKYNLSLKDSKEYVDDFMRKTNIEDKKQVKNKGYNKLVIESAILFLLGVACIIAKQILGVVLFMALAYACYPKNKKSNNANNISHNDVVNEEKEIKLIKCPCCGNEISNMSEKCLNCGQPINSGVQMEKSDKNISGLICPVCKGNNINVSVDNVASGYKGKTELRKKSVVTNTANSAGRLGMTMMTGGLWLLTPKKSKYKEIQKGKTNYVKITTCICQNCGYSWNK